MKKTLYAILALLILGSLAFWLSSSNLFKGDFQELQTSYNDNNLEDMDIDTLATQAEEVYVEVQSYYSDLTAAASAADSAVTDKDESALTDAQTSVETNYYAIVEIADFSGFVEERVTNLTDEANTENNTAYDNYNTLKENNADILQQLVELQLNLTTAEENLRTSSEDHDAAQQLYNDIEDQITYIESTYNNELAELDEAQNNYSTTRVNYAEALNQQNSISTIFDEIDTYASNAEDIFTATTTLEIEATTPEESNIDFEIYSAGEDDHTFDGIQLTGLDICVINNGTDTSSSDFDIKIQSLESDDSEYDSNTFTVYSTILKPGADCTNVSEWFDSLELDDNLENVDLIITIDPDNTITEVDEENNTFELTIQNDEYYVEGVDSEDMDLYFENEDTPIVWNEEGTEMTTSICITGETTNTGTLELIVTNPDSDIEFQISDLELTILEQESGSCETVILNDLITSEITTNQPTVIINLDNGETITETNEDNNTGTETFNISSDGDNNDNTETGVDSDDLDLYFENEETPIVWNEETKEMTTSICITGETTNSATLELNIYNEYDENIYSINDVGLNILEQESGSCETVILNGLVTENLEVSTFTVEIILDNDGTITETNEDNNIANSYFEDLMGNEDDIDLYFEDESIGVEVGEENLYTMLCIEGKNISVEDQSEWGIDPQLGFTIYDKDGVELDSDSTELQIQNREGGTCEETNFYHTIDLNLDETNYTVDVFIDSSEELEETNEDNNQISIVIGFIDTDGDLIEDNEDNCINKENNDQADTDSDGIGNACEGDEDSDNVPDDLDNCVSITNTDQADTDKDGIGNACELDTDSDGIVDDVDNCIDDSNESQDDEDLNGIGDVCEEEVVFEGDDDVDTGSDDVDTGSDDVDTGSDDVDTGSDDVDTGSDDVDEECTDPFTDTTGHWGEDIICEMFEADIVKGRTYSTFAPDETLTKAEWIKILVLASGQELSYGTNFTDVYDTDWFYPYISTAEQLGYVHGDTFEPNTAITRAEAVLFTIRFTGQTLYGYTDTGFHDVDLGAWYAYAVIIANTTEVTLNDGNTTSVIEGYSDGNFHPDDNLSRAEAMAIIQRAILAWF